GNRGRLQLGGIGNLDGLVLTGVEAECLSDLAGSERRSAVDRAVVAAESVLVRVFSLVPAHQAGDVDGAGIVERIDTALAVNADGRAEGGAVDLVAVVAPA